MATTALSAAMSHDEKKDDVHPFFSKAKREK
jgi:hypothetical protein